MDTAVTVEKVKPPLPTLWFDTSIAINLTKLIRGEPIEFVQSKRLDRLSRALRDKTQKGKLLCIEGDQREEIRGTRIQTEVERSLSQFSRGIKLRHRIGIRARHTHIAMQSYLSGRGSIVLPYQSYFYEEPVTELSFNNNSRFLVDARISLAPELLARFRQTKTSTGQDLEALRLRRQGVTYDAQLQVEREGIADEMLETLRRFYAQSEIPGMQEFETVQNYISLLSDFASVRGNEATFVELYWFLKSPHYLKLPSQDIATRIYADLIVGTRSIKASDPMDVDLLSTALPVCHFVVADKDMAGRITRLGLDRDYGVEVYRIRNLDLLSAKLEAL